MPGLPLFLIEIACRQSDGKRSSGLPTRSQGRSEAFLSCFYRYNQIWSFRICFPRQLSTCSGIAIQKWHHCLFCRDWDPNVRFVEPWTILTLTLLEFEKRTLLFINVALVAVRRRALTKSLSPVKTNIWMQHIFCFNCNLNLIDLLSSRISGSLFRFPRKEKEQGILLCNACSISILPTLSHFSSVSKSWRSSYAAGAHPP